VDQEEDEAHDQPDDWEGVEDALQEGFHVVSGWSLARCIGRMPLRGGGDG
jgi:hypothetical protein